MRLNKDFIRLLLNCSTIGIGAIFGVLTRVGVNILFGPTRANITSRQGVFFFDLPANVFGCFVIGMYNSMQEVWHIPSALTLGISTGYAGSLTTFASWHLQVIRMLVDGRVLESFLALFVGLCLAVCTLVIGADFGKLTIHFYDIVSANLKDKSLAPSASFPERREYGEESPSMIPCSSISILTGCTFAIFAALFAAMVVGTVVDRDQVGSSRLFWTSATFAPVGALLRWRLSYLNRFKPQFPIGTYTSNMLAVILDLALLTSREIHEGLSSEASFFFTALIAGLGGSLSTVSTWLSEALKLPPGQKYVYISGMSISAVLLGIAIYGVAVWVNVN